MSDNIKINNTALKLFLYNACMHFKSMINVLNRRQFVVSLHNSLNIYIYIYIYWGYFQNSQNR